MNSSNHDDHDHQEQEHTHDHNDILKDYTGILIIDWKTHLLWLLSIACFILPRLWWLIPLPGDTYLPPYRTYPGTFLNHFFVSLGIGFASRSLPIALISRPFTDGIHPNSVVEYGSTGGYAAMWSSIRYRSGFRYFFTASLVTAAILLGNALEGELQSSVTIRYKASSDLVTMGAIECQHSTVNDYQVASSAYADGMITHTESDIPSRIMSNFSAVPYFSVSLPTTNLTSIQNISFTTPLTKRHHTRCTEDEDEETITATYKTSMSNGVIIASKTASTYNSYETSISNGAIFASRTATSEQSSSTVSPSANTSLATPQRDTVYLSINGHKFDLNKTYNELYSFNSSQLFVSRNSDSSYSMASNATVGGIRLNVFRYTTPDHQEAVLVYSDSTIEGVFISTTSTNYTCEFGHCFPTTTDPVPNPHVIADAAVQSMQSNTGLYGTQSLVLNILNRKQSDIQKQSKLIDALYMNPNCPESLVYPSQGRLVLPYSAAHWTTLGLIWIFLYIGLYIIGAYLIGYSEKSWSRLAQTRHMIPQIIHNSANLFIDGNSGQTVNETAYLNQKTGKMSFVREHNHGYSVEKEVLPEEA